MRISRYIAVNRDTASITVSDITGSARERVKSYIFDKTSYLNL